MRWHYDKINRKVLDLTKISSTASIELKVKFNVEDISIGLEVLCILQTLMIVDQKMWPRNKSIQEIFYEITLFKFMLVHLDSVDGEKYWVIYQWMLAWECFRLQGFISRGMPSYPISSSATKFPRPRRKTEGVREPYVSRLWRLETMVVTMVDIVISTGQFEI